MAASISDAALQHLRLAAGASSSAVHRVRASEMDSLRGIQLSGLLITGVCSEEIKMALSSLHLLELRGPLVISCE
jgi:hypothetical protein